MGIFSKRQNVYIVKETKDYILLSINGKCTLTINMIQEFHDNGFEICGTDYDGLYYYLFKKMNAANKEWLYGFFDFINK